MANVKLTDNITQILDFVNAQMDSINSKIVNADLVLQDVMFVFHLHNALNAQKIIQEN